MAVISAIYNVLKTQIPNQIARYSDEFYPTSTGDNLMKAFLLFCFEGGHFPDDYQRFGTRKYYTIVCFTALSSIGLLEKKTFGLQKIF